ncbi:MAG: TetR/AcrR family transcriptional regulator [Paracoccus sp. (in: a-proteobacteria)]
MKDDKRQKRHEAISATAYDLLASHGYGGTTMLRIAQAARASNETLYRWYGDKDGLFHQMVEDNAAETRQLLEEALEGAGDPFETLGQVGPVFLRMLLGERAILLNRAAAADPSGRLGAAISAGGRQEVSALLGQVVERLCAGQGHTAERATGWFLDLLVGDSQIRRVIGEMPVPDEAEIARRCRQALADFRQLIGA